MAPSAPESINPMAAAPNSPEANISSPITAPPAPEAPKQTSKLTRLLNFLLRRKAKQAEPVNVSASPIVPNADLVEANDREWAPKKSTFPTAVQMDQHLIDKTPGNQPRPSSDSLGALEEKLKQDVKADQADNTAAPQILDNSDKQAA